ncbi:hypothetical protein INR49_026789 [Caranx melampygus]|nr:hypothetical protein INR49_026789 [Caranx melampygus]
MAQWQELLRLNLIQDHLSEIYETKFPRHIRHCLRVWTRQLRMKFKQVLASMLFCCFWNNSGTLLLNRSMSSGTRFPRDEGPPRNFQANPLNLAIILSECLQKEKKVLASASEKQSGGSPAVDQSWRELDIRIHEVKRQTKEVKREIKSLEVLYDNHDFILKTWQNKGVVVLQQIVKILKQAEQMVAALTEVQLPEWKRRQQGACIGGPFDTCLDNLQKWFTAVAEVLMQVHQGLQKLQEQNQKYKSNNTSGLYQETEKSALLLLRKLLTSALVVEKQPVMASLTHRPLILKIGVRFTAGVRFLVNLPELKCLLKVQPVFDKDLEENTTVSGPRHFEFSRDNSKVLDVDSPGGGLVAEFAHMSLKEKQQSKVRAKGPCQSQSRLGVTEELHIIKFVTVYQHAGVTCDIEASSLPVVVISSTSQVPSAWASVMWCNMLSTSEPRNLSLFADPSPLTWQQLSQVLSWQFLSVGQRGLDENQLSMLRGKFVDDSADLIHWCKFSKSDSPWFWIDGILDLIRKHLVDLWRDGCIMGFVSRKTTKKLLEEKQTGTFLLRFSESIQDGAITFSWVEHANDGTHVHSVEPYSKKDLLNLSLPDIIYIYSLKSEGNTTRNPLLYLYPDIHKNTAFGRYCTLSEMEVLKNLNGYLRRNHNFSVDPTPPSPPPQEIHMDTEADSVRVTFYYGLYFPADFYSAFNENKIFSFLVDSGSSDSRTLP